MNKLFIALLTIVAIIAALEAYEYPGKISRYINLFESLGNKGPKPRVQINPTDTIEDLKKKVAESSEAKGYLNGQSWESLKCYDLSTNKQIEEQNKPLVDLGFGPSSSIECRL